jgi:hypothetical protein
VEAVISSLKKITVKCCNRQCLKHLLEENEASLRVFLEEWLQLEKKQQQAVLHFTIRLCSHWSTKTVRGLKRQLNRFEFEDPILGSLCRKAYATILGIGEATLTRHITVVHQSGGRFAPSAHKSKGQDGHHQLPSQIREFVIKFLVNIAEAVFEPSSGRHSLRNESPMEKSSTESKEKPVIFLPAMYSLRLLHRLYNEEVKQGHFPSKYRVLWNSPRSIFHSPELSWLKIRAPRDDVCDTGLLYRRKMADLLNQPENKSTLKKLGKLSNELVQHRDLAVATRNIYRNECKIASVGALSIQKALEKNTSKDRLPELLSQYEAHYSFDFSQNLM